MKPHCADEETHLVVSPLLRTRFPAGFCPGTKPLLCTLPPTPRHTPQARVIMKISDAQGTRQVRGTPESTVSAEPCRSSSHCRQVGRRELLADCSLSWRALLYLSCPSGLFLNRISPSAQVPRSVFQPPQPSTLDSELPA